MNKRQKQESNEALPGGSNHKRRRRRKTSKSAVTVESKTDIKWLNHELPSVWQMTSKELYEDPPVRLNDVAAYLRDNVAMSTFKSAILENRHFFMKRKVLVIGCNMLTLPLWAAKSGAKQVFVVDTSKALEYLRLVVKAQNLENVIRLFNSRIEKLSLPTGKVDVIISNWMGYSLLGDSKCFEVIYARDKWLKKDGVIMPDKAQLYLAGIQNSQKKYENIDWWRNVYDFNMQAMRALVLRSAVHQRVEKHEIMTKSFDIWEIDMEKATYKDLQVNWKGSIEAFRDGPLEGLITYFKVYFTKSHKSLRFSTAPSATMTSWMQTIFYFDTPMPMNAGDLVKCQFAMRTIGEVRNFENVSVNVELLGGSPDCPPKKVALKWILNQMPVFSETDVKTE